MPGSWLLTTILLYTPLEYTLIHYTTIHFTSIYYTSLNHSTLLHSLTIHNTSLHYTTLKYTTLHCTTLHYTKLHYFPQHYTTLNYNNLFYIYWTVLLYLALHIYMTMQHTSYKWSEHYTLLLLLRVNWMKPWMRSGQSDCTALHQSTALHYTTIYYTILN